MSLHVQLLLLLIKRLAPTLLLLASLSSGQDRSLYYRLTDIDVGGLSIRGLHIAGVALDTSNVPSGGDSVRLSFLGGVMTLACRTEGDPCVSGALSRAPQTAGELQGKFVWQGEKIQRIHLNILRLHVRSPILSSQVIGGLFEPSPSRLVSIENTSPVDFGPQNIGTLKISFPLTKIKDAHIELADMPVKATLESHSLIAVQLNLQEGSVSLVSGKFGLESASSNISSAVNKLFGKTIVNTGAVEMSELALNVQPPTVTVARVAVRRPTLTHADAPSLPIVAASQLEASNLSGKAAFTASSAQASTVTVDTVRISPDWLDVINRLNQHWVNDPDVLLPTGDPNLHYVTLSALDTFYRGLAKAKQDRPNLYRIYVATSGDLVRSTSTEVIPATKAPSANPAPHGSSGDQNAPTGLARLCLIFDGKIAGGAATVAATYLVNMVLPQSMILAPSFAAALRVATLLAPEFGAPAFIAVYGTTTVMKAVAGNEIAKRLTNEAKEYCELLLGEGKPSRVVELPTPVDNPNQNYNEQMNARYKTYVDSRTRAGLGMEPNVPPGGYSFLRDESAARAEYSRVIDLRSNAWVSKHREDLEKARVEENRYQQGLKQRQAEIQAENAQTGSQVIRQLRETEERKRALQNTPIVSTPPISTGDPSKPKTYIISNPK